MNTRPTNDTLNMALMNLPCQPDEQKYPKYSAVYFAYKEGHRDARHAAVEKMFECVRQDSSEEGMFSEEWKDGYSVGFEAAKNLLANKDK